MATPVYCRTCGTRLSLDHLFCPMCGASQTGADQAHTNLPQPESAMSGTGRLSPGRVLQQRYRLLHPVGQGGMGAVYVAQDTQLGDRLVAVKEMSLSRLLPQDIPQAVEQFRQEAHLLASLHHPSLPVIHEYFREGNRWYLVMSFIEGQNLQTVLDAAPGNRLAVSEVMRIGMALCEVLEYLHTHEPQIIFRDLKPLNIMLTPKGQICLIDFGIARHFKQEQTKDTTFYYSVGYAPPEQYGQAQTGPRSDLYSLGATLHHLLSGHNPAKNPFRFAPLHLVDASIPESLASVIAQMVEMDAQARPANAAEVQARLKRLLPLPQHERTAKPLTGYPAVMRTEPVSIPPSPPLILKANSRQESTFEPYQHVPSQQEKLVLPSPRKLSWAKMKLRIFSGFMFILSIIIAFLVFLYPLNSDSNVNTLTAFIFSIPPLLLSLGTFIWSRNLPVEEP